MHICVCGCKNRPLYRVPQQTEDPQFEAFGPPYKLLAAQKSNTPKYYTRVSKDTQVILLESLKCVVQPLKDSEIGSSGPLSHTDVFKAT